jgi:hypothetical protein
LESGGSPRPARQRDFVYDYGRTVAMKPRLTYTEIFRPCDMQQVIMIKMALEREGIRYFIANENLNSLLPPIGFAGFIDMQLMVESGRTEESLQILRNELDLIPR